jgi:hypothetical protein
MAVQANGLDQHFCEEEALILEAPGRWTSRIPGENRCLRAARHGRYVSETQSPRHEDVKMKQSAAKTLGVAALGAAFAAAGAGAANAAPGVAPDLTEAAKTLPAKVATDSLGEAQDTVGNAAGQVAASTLPAPIEEAPPVAGLLGGLPTTGLPTQGLPLGSLGLS